jgi:hypothetical protein
MSGGGSLPISGTRRARGRKAREMLWLAQAPNPRRGLGKGLARLGRTVFLWEAIMTTMTTARRATWMRRGAMLLVPALMIAGGLRQDELDCEEAVAYLQGCCPDFGGATIQCVANTGCLTSVSPALSIQESQCIRSESCDQVVQSGLCERVKNLPSPTVDDLNDASDISHPPVCP